MSNFFINRPIFAWVLAIATMLAGTLALFSLPVSQYPNVSPPAVAIIAAYPGASAETVQDTVAQVIEQQMNGLDGMRYIQTQSNADGSMVMVITFEQGTDPDIAQVQVQNKLQLATPLLPQEVQAQGMRVAKYQINFMLIGALVSEDGSMSSYALGDYLVSNLQDTIVRTPGVGDFLAFGSQNAMRIWLDPAKLNNYALTPSDVIAAIQEQNVQVSAGQLGGRPSVEGAVLSATVNGKTRYQTVEEFENILLKVNRDGSQVRIHHVADVALDAENFAISGKYNNMPAAGLALRLATGANVLDTVERVKEVLKEQEPFLPDGVSVVYPYDTSPVVSASMESVAMTLIEAIILVTLVMYLFLQNIRATLIPALAVPVVVLGTFGVMAWAGFNLNILTMFGLVLAIGMLVDDAIVVVENVERVMVEEGLGPKEATIKSMGQLQGALVGIGLVLSAVFVPMAFFGGSAGVIYRQFSITIVVAMTLSVFVALIFTPALCATMLKPVSKGHQAKRGFFGWFNRRFDSGTRKFERGVSQVLKRKGAFMLVYLLIVAAAGWMFQKIPTSFLPDEDQGSFVVQVQMPENSSSQQTEVVLERITEHLLTVEGDSVEGMMSVNGFNFAGRGQSSGALFIQMKPWEERTGEGQDVFSVVARANAAFSQYRDAIVIAFAPPAIMELGNATGFDFYLQDRGGLGHEALMDARNQFLYEASQHPALIAVRPNGMNDEPQYQILIDDERVRAMGLSLADVNATMSAAWGSAYVNDFLDGNRVKKVYVQGEAASRVTPEDFNRWYVRNADGEMVPFSAFATGTWVVGSPRLDRFNGLPAVQILGEPAPGYSSGDAMAAVEEIATRLPQGFAVEWAGLSYEERATGNQAPMLYLLSVIVIFLCLAALYESWSIPASVMLVIPLGVLGATAAVLMRGLGNDVFFQIGLLATAGLAAKNAILIVEFARDLNQKEGMNLVEAAIHAARLRFRPIIMTSLAFILGVVPLAIATGASSGSSQAVGTGVIGGMIAATVLAVYFVPLFYVVVSSLFKRKNPADKVGKQETEAVSP
ncbi:efflux RND transporter permease subunit [Achromobacter sp. F4_2707]|uniref:efflux RND transporter permease subunit n=1 Tax=Achromobacter sp. F4_2707 TaxID=3114286 RepID=UPI0039C65498